MRVGGNFGWRRRLFTYPITIKERINAVAFHLRYLAPLGIKEDYRQPRIFLKSDEIHDAEKSLASLGVDRSKPLVGLHLGATWPAKVWLAECFARLAELVVDKLDAQVIVTYGPKDISYFNKFSSAVRVKFIEVKPEGLRQLSAVISLCNAYVSNDASPMHISAAVGTPVIGIFGPGEPDIWFPYRKDLGHVSVHKDVQCCHCDFCELKGEDYMRCMKRIEPAEVFESVKNILINEKREA